MAVQSLTVGPRPYVLPAYLTATQPQEPAVPRVHSSDPLPETIITSMQILQDRLRSIEGGGSGPDVSTLWRNQLLTVAVRVEDVETSFVADTGSAVNTVSANFASKMKSSKTMAAAASSPMLPTHNQASAAALLPVHNHTAPADTHTTTENPMEFDARSGRTIPPLSPWQQMLRKRRNFKQAATTPPLPALRTQPTSPRTTPAPRLPDTDYKIIYRPRAGLRVAAWNDRQMTQSIEQASKIPYHVFNAYVTIQPQASQNLIVASTPDENCATALSEITALQLGTTTHEVVPYLKPLPGTVRGVIHGLDHCTTTEQLPYILAPNGPSILHARMLGASTCAVVDFEGPHVPFYIKAYGLFKRCRPYRQTVHCCSLCGDLGHRRDVCPTPDTLVCAQCHTKNPTPDHGCAPTCQLCGLDHPAASKELLKKIPPIAPTLACPGTCIFQAADLPQPAQLPKPVNASTTTEATPSTLNPTPGRLERLIHDTGNQINTRFAALERRFQGIKETKRKAPKKPKHRNAPKDPDNTTHTVLSDDDTFQERFRGQSGRADEAGPPWSLGNVSGFGSLLGRTRDGPFLGMLVDANRLADHWATVYHVGVVKFEWIGPSLEGKEAPTSLQKGCREDSQGNSALETGDWGLKYGLIHNRLGTEQDLIQELKQPLEATSSNLPQVLPPYPGTPNPELDEPFSIAEIEAAVHNLTRNTTPETGGSWIRLVAGGLDPSLVVMQRRLTTHGPTAHGKDGDYLVAAKTKTLSRTTGNAFWGTPSEQGIMPETRSETSTVPPSAADSSDMEAHRGAGSSSNSRVEGTNVSLELERERILLWQMEIQLKLAELNARSGVRAVRSERDLEIERGEALKHYSKMLHGAIPKFPHDAEVPVWFETVECLFQRYAVPVEIQAHLVYPLIATRLAYLCASMKDGEFTFEHLRSVVLAELRLSAEEYRKRFTAATSPSEKARTGLTPRAWPTFWRSTTQRRAPLEAQQREKREPLHAPPRNCHVCGSPSHRAAECTRTRETKASTSHANVRHVVLDEPGPDPLTMRVASVWKERSTPSSSTHVQVTCGQTIRPILDSGTEITVVRESLLPTGLVEPSGSVMLESAFGEKVKAILVVFPMSLIKPDAPTLEEVCGRVSVMCTLTNDLAPHTDCLLALDAWEALSTGARHDTIGMRADVFGRTHPDKVVCAAQVAARADIALDSAEPFLNCHDASQLRTSRALLQTTDDDPTLGKAKQRSVSFGTRRDDPTLATAICDAGLAVRGTFVETCVSGNPTAQTGNLGTRKTVARIKRRCPPWRQRGGSTYLNLVAALGVSSPPVDGDDREIVDEAKGLDPSLVVMQRRLTTHCRGRLGVRWSYRARLGRRLPCSREDEDAVAHDSGVAHEPVPKLQDFPVRPGSKTACSNPFRPIRGRPWHLYATADVRMQQCKKKDTPGTCRIYGERLVPGRHGRVPRHDSESSEALWLPANDLATGSRGIDARGAETAASCRQVKCFHVGSKTGVLHEMQRRGAGDMPAAISPVPGKPHKQAEFQLVTAQDPLKRDTRLPKRLPIPDRSAYDHFPFTRYSDVSPYPHKSAHAASVTDANGKELTAVKALTASIETVEEVAIAIAATTGEEYLTILTDSQAACRNFLIGRISQPALAILQQHENATRAVDRSCPLASPRQERSRVLTFAHRTFAEKCSRVASIKLPQWAARLTSPDLSPQRSLVEKAEVASTDVIAYDLQRSSPGFVSLGLREPLDKAGSDVQLQPGKVRLALRQGAPQTFTVRYRQADDYPVDLYYLMDLTHSMKDHRDKVAELADDMDAQSSSKVVTRAERLKFPRCTAAAVA
ncbi:hypothetical protein HPB47_022450 [Ixodes persulcatus]|uniref:Uncharacterized protein n=1 Tax=Ixodes persulcatus TaxID=34615 RepID=A0AC60Q9R2_IXOPE|nr:hypothetical protein HPB47_022450 [Ixodes persulcatus]